MFSGTRSSIRRLSASAVLVSLGVFALLVVIGGSTADATLSDGDVVLGAAPTNVCTPGTNVNCTNSLTGIVNTTSGGDAFHGFSASGTGVGGFSNTGDGIKGETGGSGNGVRGQNSASGDGVFGSSASGDGVSGSSDSGRGGSFQSNSGFGVVGTGKPGVEGAAGSVGAVGVVATDSDFAGATALKVSGKSSFTRSGRLTVSAGTSSATKSPISLSSGSLVLTTIQGNQPGVYVQGVTKVTGTSGSFTIHLNKNTTANLPVAWFVVN